MNNIVALANQKGGVAKTDVTKNLAAALAEKEQKILVVDMDPQGSLGISFGINVYDLEKNISDVMIEGINIQDVIVPARDNIDLVPSNIYLSGAEPKLANVYRREDRLKNALSSIKDAYDFVLIDCPPSLGLLTINALSAANKILIPVSCDFFALEGVKLLLTTISEIQTQVNPDLQVMGLVATRYDKRTRNSEKILIDIRTELGQEHKIFNAVIRETVRIREAPSIGQTIFEYSGSHPVAQDYRNLAKEILEL